MKEVFSPGIVQQFHCRFVGFVGFVGFQIDVDSNGSVAILETTKPIRIGFCFNDVAAG